MIPRFKNIKPNDVLSIMFTAYGCGQSLECRVLSLDCNKDGEKVLSVKIMPENKETCSVWVGGVSIFNLAMSSYKDGVINIKSKHWNRWTNRIVGFYREKEWQAMQVSKDGKIENVAEGALMLSSKEEMVRFLSRHI